MSKYFVGYVNKGRMETVTDEQARKLTHLNIAFAPMVGDITVMELEDTHIKELNRIKKANPNLNILVSTGGGNNHGHGEATRTPEGLMTYDSNTGGKMTGHHTNLYEPAGDGIRPHSADYHIRLMVSAGVRIEKILIGAAFYSQQWNHVPDVNHGYRQESTELNNWGPGYTEIVEKYESKNGYVKYFDEAAKAPYLFNGSTFFSYDDKESVKCKCEYAKAHHMAGIFYWVHDADVKGELFDVIYENL